MGKIDIVGLENTALDSKLITVRVSGKLHASLEALDRRLEQSGGQSKINRSAVVESALAKFVSQVNEMLDKKAIG